MTKKGASSAERAAPFEARLQLLHNDHLSPSVALTCNAIDLAEDWLKAGLSARKLAREFLHMHPGVAAIENLATLLSKPGANALSGLAALRSSLQEGNRHIADRLARLIPPQACVITLSNSGTVEEALIRIAARVVYLMESRPGGEHVLMLQQLRRRFAEARIDGEVHLIEATAIGNVVPRVDCAVVGIDSISVSGAILHKVGTLPLALCCRHFGKPFYALGHSFKQVRYEFEEPGSGSGLVETRIFDSTPGALITAVITEQSASAAKA
jgi:translation initiation factor eIF-2B subunit delta